MDLPQQLEMMRRQTAGQKGADRTAPSAGESGGSGRKGRGQRQSGSNQQSGSDSDQSGRQRKAKQSGDTSNG